MRGETIMRALRVRSESLLAFAALLGLSLAALGAFAPSAPRPGDAAALVNGVPVARADHERVIEALAASKRNPLDTEDRDYALTRLIDEELLLQRSVELGLHRNDPASRKRLVAAMLEWIAAGATDTAPEEETLRTFYKDNRALFTPAARIEADWFHVARSEPDGEAQARRMAGRLAEGDSFSEVARDAAPSAMRPPDGLLPPAKLRDYLGPSLTEELLTLSPGEPAGPFVRRDGWHFLLVRRREPGAAPAFKDVRGQVEAEYLRHQADDAVRRYLERLRRRADITIAADTDK
ncbi:MAG: peptidyl-prolyl cis-trans isomerase [Alphaproteobacteria bacterium]